MAFKFGNTVSIDEEQLIESAVDSLGAALAACLKENEIKYSELAGWVDYGDLAREIDYEDFAEQVDVEALAAKVSCESIAEHICCETVAGYVKYDAVVELVKDELPQIEDLDVLQGRLNEMWEFYMSFKTYFSSDAAAPVNADGELK
jgi:hypothetical protein